MTPHKRYIGAQELLEKSTQLAMQIYQDDFMPDYIVGVWRGGSPVGITVQELFSYLSCPADHIAIRTSSYTRINERSQHILVHGLSYLSKRLNSEDNLLIVDDVFETGHSIGAILDELQKRCRKNLPTQIRVATLFDKPQSHLVDKGPDYFLEQTTEWLVFPHEIKDLSIDELRLHKPWAWEALKMVKPSR